jgi:hypothetical protein
MRIRLTRGHMRRCALARRDPDRARPELSAPTKETEGNIRRVWEATGEGLRVQCPDVGVHCRTTILGGISCTIQAPLPELSTPEALYLGGTAGVP